MASHSKSFVPPEEGGLSFIEQLQIVSHTPCSKTNTPHLTGINQNEHKAILIKTACKMWNCPTCAARLAKFWIAKVINGVNKLGGNWYFFTITSSRKMRGAKSIKAIRDGWKKLYNRILSLYGKNAKDLYYVKVWEQHKDGSFHLHMLANFPITRRWLKDNAHSCGLGYQAHVKPIDNAGQVAGYMAKYTLKNGFIEQGGVAIPKGLRRIETSHKWPEFPKMRGREYEWIFDNTRQGQLHRAWSLEMSGYKIIDTVK